MASLPKFNSEGRLPPGDYTLTFKELRASTLIVGPGADHTHWDAPWRLKLVDNLEILVRQLHKVGVTQIFVNGSFVEDKDHPNDIDGYFECDRRQVLSGKFEQEINLLDRHKIWTWDPKSRRPYRGYAKRQLPMWHQYRVELYPHVGQPSGIQDRYGNDLEFPAAFRQSRLDNKPKGIVKIGDTP